MNVVNPLITNKPAQAIASKRDTVAPGMAFQQLLSAEIDGRGMPDNPGEGNIDPAKPRTPAPGKSDSPSEDDKDDKSGLPGLEGSPNSALIDISPLVASTLSGMTAAQAGQAALMPGAPPAHAQGVRQGGSPPLSSPSASLAQIVPGSGQLPLQAVAATTLSGGDKSDPTFEDAATGSLFAFGQGMPRDGDATVQSAPQRSSPEIPVAPGHALNNERSGSPFAQAGQAALMPGAPPAHAQGVRQGGSPPLSSASLTQIVPGSGQLPGQAVAATTLSGGGRSDPTFEDAATGSLFAFGQGKPRDGDADYVSGEALAGLVVSANGRDGPPPDGSGLAGQGATEPSPLGVAQLMPPSHSSSVSSHMDASDTLPQRVGSPDWDYALGRKLVWMVEGAQQAVTLTLNPPDLGPMRIVLSLSDNQVGATFISAQPEVRAAIEAAMPRLHQMMESAGLQMGGSSVGSGASNADAGGGRQSYRQDWPGGQGAGQVEPVSGAPAAASASAGQGMIDTHA
ncbi:MAG: flagellar hook-length control protein FliK [Proteobacteria bacterium]|nr:flagellar hook-length control protein FliK [Pseudomonadota bacterium]